MAEKSPSIRAGEIEQLVVAQIRESGSDTELIETLAACCDTTKRVSASADLTRRQETANRRLDKIGLELESLTAEQVDTASAQRGTVKRSRTLDAAQTATTRCSSSNGYLK